MRLIREAREWGKSYKFWSCADVDIVPRKSALLVSVPGFRFGARDGSRSGSVGSKVQNWTVFFIEETQDLKGNIKESKTN